MERFKLIKPCPTKSEEKDDWQHPTPHSIKTNTFTQHTDSQTQETQQIRGRFVWNIERRP